MSDAAASQEDWASEYENIVEFYFWEPQHLNRVSPAKDKRHPPKQVLAALMKREVPLNHQLNIFFRLAPTELKERWLAAGLPRTASSRPILTSLRGDPVYGACQPDLYFQSASSRSFMELKVEARSGLAQLCKYGLLSAYLDRLQPQAAGIQFMGPSERKFASLVEALKVRHDAGFNLPEKVASHAARLGVEPGAVVAAVREMEVAFSTYAQLDGCLAAEAENLLPGSPGNETLLNLIGGMRRFMRPLVGPAVT